MYNCRPRNKGSGRVADWEIPLRSLTVAEAAGIAPVLQEALAGLHLPVHTRCTAVDNAPLQNQMTLKQ